MQIRDSPEYQARVATLRDDCNFVVYANRQHSGNFSCIGGAHNCQSQATSVSGPVGAVANEHRRINTYVAFSRDLDEFINERLHHSPAVALSAA